MKRLPPCRLVLWFDSALEDSVGANPSASQCDTRGLPSRSSQLGFETSRGAQTKSSLPRLDP